MSDIFISYSREDRVRVKPLAEALQNTCGWSVWWDVRIPAGQTFDEVIEAALDEARCVIVVWSEISIKSHWVKTEAAEGRGRGILVPVSIDNVRIPLAFRRIQAANFISWKGDTNAEDFQKLWADITSVLGEPLQKNPPVNSEMANLPKAVTFNRKFEQRNKGKQEFGTTTAKLGNHSYLEPELVQISGGKFLMGSPESEKDRADNEQQHEVFIDDFAIGKYPVTFVEYDRYCEETGRKNPDDEDWGRGNRPVIIVTWVEAYDYAVWLAEVTNKPYRLPTEAEWEFAARGGTQTAYWWGNKFEEGRINCAGSHGKTTPVDSFKPNPFGLYDMLGNVLEWTGSLYKQDYDGSEQKCTEKEYSGLRVIRGGSWGYLPRYARSAFRHRGSPGDRDVNIGFRLAQD